MDEGPSRLERVEREGMEILCRRAEERAVKSSKNIRKRVGGEEEPNKRNKKKMRTIKHAVANRAR